MQQAIAASHQIVIDAIALHRKWIAEHATDDDPDEIDLDELLPETTIAQPEIVSALLAVGCDVGNDGGQIVVRLPVRDAI